MLFKFDTGIGSMDSGSDILFHEYDSNTIDSEPLESIEDVSGSRKRLYFEAPAGYGRSHFESMRDDVMEQNDLDKFSGAKAGFEGTISALKQDCDSIMDDESYLRKAELVLIPLLGPAFVSMGAVAHGFASGVVSVYQDIEYKPEIPSESNRLCKSRNDGSEREYVNLDYIESDNRRGILLDTESDDVARTVQEWLSDFEV